MSRSQERDAYVEGNLSANATKFANWVTTRQYVDRTSVTPAIHRLRNRDSELCNPRRADSADWSITLGWPSADCYYSKSTLESFALAPHFLLVSLSLSDFSSRVPFPLSFSSLQLPLFFFPPVSARLFLRRLLLPARSAFFRDLSPPRVSLFPN